MYKTCTKCSKSKNLEEYDRDKGGKYGRKSYCVECRRDAYQKVKVTRREKNLEWRKNNKDRYLSKMREYERLKRKNDPCFRLAKLVRVRVREVLLGKRKGSPTLEMLGCSFQELKNHLESRFVNGMSWDNYGKWHIDHIRPCSSFDLTNLEQQKICFNYKNLQPLWAEDNIRKGCKIIDS